MLTCLHVQDGPDTVMLMMPVTSVMDMVTVMSLIALMTMVTMMVFFIVISVIFLKSL